MRLSPFKPGNTFYSVFRNGEGLGRVGLWKGLERKLSHSLENGRSHKGNSPPYSNLPQDPDFILFGMNPSSSHRNQAIKFSTWGVISKGINFYMLRSLSQDKK